MTDVAPHEVLMESPPDRLPLVIGVTGHRDLRDEDLPQLEREVSRAIARLRRDFLAKSRETPVVVLSALAEGADRLVARAALAEGARLIAPLPMPLEEYRRDFDHGAGVNSTAEFDALFAQAVAAPVMPFTRGNSLEAVRADPKQRDEQYRAVGLYIALHSDVLIALWDGDDQDMAAGGTAEVVSFKRNGIPLAVSGSARASLDASEIGPVIHIVVPRKKAGSPAAEIAVKPWGREMIKRYRGGSIRRILRGVAAFVARVFGQEFADAKPRLSNDERRELDRWETFAPLVALTQKFNEETARLAKNAEGRARTRRNLDDLFAKGDREPRVDPASAQKTAIERAERWCRMYAIADTLAQERQAQFRLDWRRLFLLGFVAFVCFALFSHIGLESDVLLILYCVSFIVIFILFGAARIGQHQERFLDYRALAEALRVAVFWELLGIGRRYRDAKTGFSDSGSPVTPDTLGVPASAYPIKQPNELAWVKICLRTLELPDGNERQASSNALDMAGHAIARYFWVYGQYSYFRRQGFRHNHIAEIFESNAILLSALSPFLIVPVLLAFTSAPHEGHQSILRLILIIISGLLPGLAAVLAGYSERLALKAQARQYDRMRMLFGRAFELLPETIDAETAPLIRALYIELGAEAMKENAEWVAIYRQRPIQPMS
ncbi:MAG TPA: hypothetical protein VKT73_03235 [Xanthobacteraceae bacterium]|nr:hypothetical protein [Xanthobacteraceae bacterium]